MTLKTGSDQADGLRRLMGRDRGRLVAVVGSHPRVGATSTALHLAAALWQQGQNVLVLDEHGGARSASAACSEPARASWPEVAAQSVSLAAAAGRAWGAVPVLAAQPDRMPAALDPRRAIAGRIALVDAALDEHGRLSPLARRADDVLVVLQPQPHSLQAAYARIKALHHAHALLQLRILLTQAGDAAESDRICGNLVRTGGRYLAMALEPAGCIRADAQLPQAQRLGLGVVQAFPAAPSAADLRRIAAELLHWPVRAAPAAAAAA
ncbi:flagellar biosynthesis protein FlhG [Ramlibacter tataouinensis]|uniref:MinD/ParA family ATP-binding protein n=1 Tax=Ramlibacter tataouinensis TaxID=94132 RepID=UPI0022F3A942|nr:flagellar biosynthesis protein FlhG [Ramlibacter tataouinensis]WBY00585.1 flagellar biosynthesis protein FlhG [Ramlibacter tataouinensis]